MLPALDPPNALCDADGTWCAICLEYGKDDDRLVPVIPAQIRRKYLSKTRTLGRTLELPFGDLYAHTNCLAAMPVVSRIPDVILDYVSNARRLTGEQIDHAAKTYHEQGLYSVSAALKDMLLQRQMLSRETGAASLTLERKIASLAGVANASRRRSLSKRFVRRHANEPGVLLHVANWHANFGWRREAEDVLRVVERERHKLRPMARKSSEAHYRMRVAQIRRTLSAARDAIRTAQDDPYMYNTAYILAGQLHAPEQPTRARTYFEAVLAKGLNVSWLYRAESLFGIASLMLRAHDSVHEAYKFLVAAQYIWAVLRLQGMPHVDMHPALPQATLKPGTVVYYDARLSQLSKGERLALRQIAVIESGLRNQLLSTLLFLLPHEGRWPDTFEAQRRSRVLVLGQDTSAVNTLRQIVAALAEYGYAGVLVKDQPELADETNEGKVLRLAAMSRFVIVEQSIPAGQIDELQLLAPRGYVVAILHQEGTQATWMQSDYDIAYRMVSYFAYVRVKTAVRQACRWAEATLHNKELALRNRYPWRRKPPAA